VVTTDRAPDAARAAIGAAAEVATITASGPQRRVDLGRLLLLLGSRDILSVLVEGGAEVNGAFFDAGLVDGVAAFLAPLVIGGRAAPGAVGGEGVVRLADAHQLENVLVRRVGDDLLIEGDVHRDR
jgi:diaminohydroxyphosphoribosylaminopyrimidine deaminase/5-amino-6-(5-phosphoribosylamino)uracil reductase